jgi:hypothetical protein
MRSGASLLAERAPDAEFLHGNDIQRKVCYRLKLGRSVTCLVVLVRSVSTI